MAQGRFAAGKAFSTHREWARGLTAKCYSQLESQSANAESQTQAFLANHSCVTRQSGHNVRLKNTGVE